MANYQALLPLFLLLATSIAAAGATQYKVGGSKGWSVPSDPNEYNQWAQKRRFQVGDSLVFMYRPDKDSVLLVDEGSYRNCDASSFIDSFNDGNTVFVFSHPGPYYFISGNRDNCLKNESLVAVVMADRTKGSGLALSPSASPSSSSSSPPVPGSNGLTPTPSGEGSNSPPQKNGGASLKVVGLMGSVGTALVGSFFVL